MNINDILNKIMKFYSWIYTETGLEQWQLLAIAFTALLALTFLLRYLRKSKIKKLYSMQKADRSEIIGIKLSDNVDSEPIIKDKVKQKAGNIQEQEVEEERNWGQSTKEWRQLSEKIRILQQEVKKYKQTEQNIKKQIADLKNLNNQLSNENIELKKTNEQLHIELNKQEQIEGEFQEEIEKLKSAILVKSQKDIDINDSNSEYDHVLSINKSNNNYSAQSSDNSNSRQNITEKSTDHNIKEINSQNEKAESSDEIQKSSIQKETVINSLKPLSSETENPALETTEQQDRDEADTDRNIPLDIKELKAIADLAKRLQSRSQQRQGE